MRYFSKCLSATALAFTAMLGGCFPSRPETRYTEPPLNSPATPVAVVTAKVASIRYVDGYLVDPAAQVLRVPAGRRVLTLSADKNNGVAHRTVSYDFLANHHYILTADLAEQPFFGVSITDVSPDGKPTGVISK